MSQSWWADLYPGDDVVDWIGLDSYVSAEKNTYHYGQFADLLDRKGATRTGLVRLGVPAAPVEADHGGRVGHVPPHQRPRWQDAGYDGVLPELASAPGSRPSCTSTCLADDEGDRNINIASTKTSLTAFREARREPPVQRHHPLTPAPPPNRDAPPGEPIRAAHGLPPPARFGLRHPGCREGARHPSGPRGG